MALRLVILGIDIEGSTRNGMSIEKVINERPSGNKLSVLITSNSDRREKPLREEI